jgi:hypothetical protein
MKSYRPVCNADLSIPRPVVAFPWGSQSISNDLFPDAAIDAARFTAVVVFPTPPFWFEIEMIHPIS